ncbi:hypothetical protein BJ170DRAFT_350905 [Xylariales sp. AK1849]|nr:hypothetical protein BJ170DRAFT_350905 [Xylariales sp. AK1849]
MQSSLGTHSLATLLLASLATAAGVKTKTSTTSTSLFLPSRSTAAGYHIYASVLTTAADATEYLLACQTPFATQYTCGGDFTGVTLTHGPSTMHLNLGPWVGLEYDCSRGAGSAGAVCTTTSSGIVATSTVATLASSASAAWMTGVTVVAVDSGTQTSSPTATTSSTTTGATSAATTTTSSGGGGVCTRDPSNNSASGAATMAAPGGESGCSTGHKGEVAVILTGILAIGAVVGAAMM